MATKAMTTKVDKAETKKAKKDVVQGERVFISDADCYLFGQGTHYDIYKKLGAHPSVEEGVEGIHFGVWAPNAVSVHVIGTFNDWNETANPMGEVGEGGVYAAFIKEAKVGDMYKYLIETPEGKKLYKADPFANHAEMRPGNASKVADINKFKWSDNAWMETRDAKNVFEEPMAIYECHIGSWMRHPREEEEGFYNYREFADRIVEYLKGGYKDGAYKMCRMWG